MFVLFQMLVPEGSIHATRTKPVKSAKYQKRTGAKKAKRLELDNNAELTLSLQKMPRPTGHLLQGATTSHRTAQT